MLKPISTALWREHTKHYTTDAALEFYCFENYLSLDRMPFSFQITDNLQFLFYVFNVIK
jgi:hypothetical protein